MTTWERDKAFSRQSCRQSAWVCRMVCRKRLFSLTLKQAYSDLHGCEGKRHDFSLLKDEFKPDKPWFNDFNIHLDLAYIGFSDKYQCKNLFIPHKKSKNKPLTENQKEENKQLSSKRVIVEHSFAGLKRFRILSDRLRLHRIDFYDDILGVCAGLWNFYLAN